MEKYENNKVYGKKNGKIKFEPFLNPCMSSCRGHANLLCTVSISSDISREKPHLLYMMDFSLYMSKHLLGS